MPNLEKGMEAFITSSRYKSNINKAVRLVEWVGPNEIFGNGDMRFLGGELGGWVVRPIHTKTMLSTVDDRISYISNFGFIREHNLCAVSLFDSVESELTAEESAGGTVFLLDDDEFDRFTRQVEENPMSKNKALQELLSRPKPWS